MSEIVAIFAASHAPPLIQRPDIVPSETSERVFGTFREMGRRLAAARPQALVLLSNEHLHNFSLANLPAVCIGMAEQYPGPSELWLNVPSQVRPGDAALGDYLHRSALEADFDPALSHEMSLDHGCLTPLHLGEIDVDLPIVPVLFNNVEPPLPTMRRCLQWGEFLGRALRAYDGLERVAVLGTGGLSHDIGTPTMGRVDEPFDREFLRLLAESDTGPLLRHAQDNVAAAGNGTEEVRNWIVTRGVAGDAALDVLFYESIPNWYVGISVAEWRIPVT